MEFPGRGWQSAWWGPLARIFVAVLVLMPLLSPTRGAHAERPGIAAHHGSVAVEAAALGRGSRCPPAAAHGTEPCTVVPCCGLAHLGCCPLPVPGVDLPDPLPVAPPASAGAAFASLRGPPPLPPPIPTSSDR